MRSAECIRFTIVAICWKNARSSLKAVVNTLCCGHCKVISVLNSIRKAIRRFKWQHRYSDIYQRRLRSNWRQHLVINLTCTWPVFSQLLYTVEHFWWTYRSINAHRRRNVVRKLVFMSHLDAECGSMGPFYLQFFTRVMVLFIGGVLSPYLLYRWHD